MTNFECCSIYYYKSFLFLFLVLLHTFGHIWVVTGGVLVPYYLNEPDLWSLDVDNLKSTVKEYRNKGINVRAIVFINPGNPTGTCLSYENLREVIKFAYDERLVLMADEVYQENVYFENRPFISCRKIMFDMGEPYASQ